MPHSMPSLVGVGGRFTVLRRLGTGELADVFAALDRKTQQRVALKLVRARQLSSPHREALRREYAALARVQHPNIARCHDLFLEDQDAFFTMELVEGTSFVDYVRGGAQGPSTSAFTGCGTTGVERLRKALPQLVQGLEALHAAGLVHRDLHPGNVRVAFGGRVVVIDYGLASEQQPISARQHPTLIGATTHAAPEQHERARQPASDWYSVGVLMFESLTGALPFAGNDHEIFVRKRTLQAPTARSLVPATPPDLDALCAQLLDRDPQARPGATAILHSLGAGP